VLAAEGELDIVSVQPLDVASLVAGASGVVLDLTRVTFFDSAATHLVDQLLRSGVPARVVAPKGGLPHRVLEIVGMLACVDEDLDAALQTLS
jgi:anti-anti-sigma regulatory factor